MTHLEQVESNLKQELSRLEAKLAGDLSKKDRKILKKKAGKIRWRLMHRWFEGDPPGYTEAMEELSADSLAKDYQKGISAEEYQQWLRKQS